jgi:hypothetical protein
MTNYVLDYGHTIDDYGHTIDDYGHTIDDHRLIMVIQSMIIDCIQSMIIY